MSKVNQGVQQGAPAKAMSMAEALAGLDQTLELLISEHEGLLELAREHKRAIGAADVTGMQACMELQEAALGRVQSLELRRQGLVRTLSAGAQAGSATGKAAGIVPAAAPPTAGSGSKTTVTTLAQRAGEPIASRLLGLGERLRDVLNRLHREHTAIREAAETLSAHMEGVMRQVCRKISHAGTYGPSAAIDVRTPVVTSLDVRT